jgi:hypothetical protein
MDPSDEFRQSVLDAVTSIGRMSTPELVKAHIPELTIEDVEAALESLVAEGRLRHADAFVDTDASGAERIRWRHYDLRP